MTDKEIEEIGSEIYDREFYDDNSFPNHTDKDVWLNGFKAGTIHTINKMMSANDITAKGYCMECDAPATSDCQYH